MTVFTRLRCALFATAACALAVAFSPLVSAAEPTAKLVASGSQIAFVTKQMNVPVEGQFKAFDAQVAFDPQKPEGCSIALQIDVASATLGVPQSDAELPKPPRFDTGRFPKATFQSTSIKGLGGGRFDIAGKLSLKGTTLPVAVPVTIVQVAGQSTATGTFTIQRLTFKIGEGEWTDTSMVGDDVQVRFKIVLTGLRPL